MVSHGILEYAMVSYDFLLLERQGWWGDWAADGLWLAMKEQWRRLITLFFSVELWTKSVNYLLCNRYTKISYKCIWDGMCVLQGCLLSFMWAQQELIVGCNPTSTPPPPPPFPPPPPPPSPPLSPPLSPPHPPPLSPPPQYDPEQIGVLMMKKTLTIMQVLTLW